MCQCLDVLSRSCSLPWPQKLIVRNSQPIGRHRLGAMPFKLLRGL